MLKIWGHGSLGSLATSMVTTGVAQLENCLISPSYLVGNVSRSTFTVLAFVYSGLMAVELKQESRST